MTVNTVSPAIISRAEFNLNAGQTKTPQLVRMDFTNLVTNGGFDTDTDWTKGTGWTIAAGVASHSTGTASLLTQPLTNITSGRRYSIGWTISSRVGGGATFFLGSGNGTFRTADGTYTEVVTYTGTSSLILSAESIFDADIDNVTLYEADPSDDAPWLRLPYGYSVGRTGMIVRDGVVLHPSDYTEVKNSGQTWIKPLVAPGVSTEFSIWGSPSYAV